MSDPRPVKPAGVPTSMIVGLALVVPALILLIVSYVEPALWTLRTSVKRGTGIPLGVDGPDPGGFSLNNYGKLADGGFFTGLAAAVGYALVPVLVVLLAAPVLAWTAHRGGTAARWVTRGLLALPLAWYAPSAFVAARIHDHGLSGAAIRTSYWWGTFGLIAALATTLYLAALRRRDPYRRPWAALGVSAGIALVAVLTAALQEFSYSLAVNSGTGEPPLSTMWTRASRFFDFGPEVAASAVVLLLVMPLGLAVTAAIVVSGLRLEFDDRWRSADEPAGWSSARKTGAAAAGVVLLIVLALTGYGLSSLLRHFFDQDQGQSDPIRILLDTWLPPLLSAAVGVLVATAAAIGIGWLRPFGRHSEWLLAPFGLFLFVGLGPLAAREYARLASDDGPATFLRLVPPWWVTIPALFVLTLLARGQAQRRASRGGASLRLLLPVLPMVLVVFLVTWVVQAQDIGWALLVNPVSDHGRVTAPMAVFRSAAFFTVPVQLALPIAAVVLVLLAAVAAQLLYLDRIALRAGRPEEPREQPPGPDPRSLSF